MAARRSHHEVGGVDHGSALARRPAGQVALDHLVTLGRGTNDRLVPPLQAALGPLDSRVDIHSGLLKLACCLIGRHMLVSRSADPTVVRPHQPAPRWSGQNEMACGLQRLDRRTEVNGSHEQIVRVVR